MYRLLVPGLYCLISLFTIGTAIKCYICDNSRTDACGESFKAYQFSEHECPRGYTKCGKQVQPPINHNGQEDWVGVIRSCYAFGSLPGINETDGCHVWTNSKENFTATYCFCSKDSCNAAVGCHGGGYGTIISVALLMSLVFLENNL